MSEALKIIHRFLQLANLPTDSLELRSAKENLMLMSTHFILVGFVWGAVYLANGLWLSSYIPFAYTVLSAIGLILLVTTKNFVFFRNTQLCLVLLMPFLLHLSLGGFIPSSGVILWAIVSPMAALFFMNTRQAIYWFAAFIGVILIAYLVDDELSKYYQWKITDAFIDALFVLNIGGVSGLVFLVQHYFATNERSLKKEVEKQNDQLEIQSDQLKELDRHKSNFFANISHEFRTPLTLIQGILNRTEPPSDRDRLIMRRNADRLLQLINQLLDLTKLESGKFSLDKKTVDLNLEIRRIAQLFGSAAEMKDINFRFNGQSILTDGAEPILASLDPEQFRKVVANLISNAVKFCPVGGQVDLNLSEVGMNILFAISNTAEDIPQEKLKHLFNRFYQVESNSVRGYEGTGIGLSLVRELITLHEGQIKATSANRVVRFDIVLPKGELRERAVTTTAELVVEPIIQKELISTASVSDHELKILVVEDYPDLREFMVDILSDRYSIITASNGEEGIQLAMEEIPDLIISDVMMPKKDGMELCAELKTNTVTDHIPIILLTARAERKDRFKGLEHGADDYLTKPFDESELVLRIKNLLRTRKRLQEKYQKEIWLKPEEVKVTSTQERFLRKVKEVIDQNLSNEELTAKDLALMMALSRSQLHRKIKALTDKSTTEFVRTYRLERGAELLKKGFGNVSEVAYAVGFNSQTYFSSSFQNYFGCSPTEYVRPEKI